MDPLLFSVKRVYWSGIARIRELVIPLGITPARADLLRVVALHEFGIAQSRLVQLLGVSPPTVSKMLAAMLEKGWITKFSQPRDGGNVIHATNDGLILIAQVIHRFLLSGALPLRMAIAWGHGEDGEELRANILRLLNRARRAFLDRAPFLHPWRKDETYVRRKYTIWEARLDADDVDETVAEDIDTIRRRAMAPIAREPPPRTAREVQNIEAHEREDAPSPLPAELFGVDGAGSPDARLLDLTNVPDTVPDLATHEEADRASTIALALDTVPDLAMHEEANATFRNPDATSPSDTATATTLEHAVHETASARKASNEAAREETPFARAAHADTGLRDDEDVPPEVALLWQKLVELGAVPGLGPDDAPKWNEGD